MSLVARLRQQHTAAEHEQELVRALGEQIGYGALMHMAANQMALQSVHIGTLTAECLELRRQRDEARFIADKKHETLEAYMDEIRGLRRQVAALEAVAEAARRFCTDWRDDSAGDIEVIYKALSGLAAWQQQAQGEGDGA